MSFVCSFYRVFQHPRRLWHQILYSLAKRAYVAPISQDQIVKNIANRKTNLAPHNSDEKTVLKAPKPGKDLTGLVGKRFLYKYDDGWVYEWYCRNHNSCDYRVHKGIVGGRWSTKQKMYATKFKENIFKVDYWHETTGVWVSLLFDLQEKNKETMHVTIFAPQWISGEGGHPEKAILYQNEFSDEGPAYPYVIVCEFATIYKIEDVGLNNDDLINEAPEQIEKEP